jgi:hypothetical protein
MTSALVVSTDESAASQFAVVMWGVSLIFLVYPLNSFPKSLVPSLISTCVVLSEMCIRKGIKMSELQNSEATSSRYGVCSFDATERWLRVSCQYLLPRQS